MKEMKEMKELLVATGNPGKFRELSGALQGIGAQIVSLKNFPDVRAIDETGKTFEENAVLKAETYGKLTGLPAVADDSGFEIDALGGEPGVKSRRWVHADRDSTDEELVAYTVERLKGVPADKRTARLRAVVAFWDGAKTVTATESIEGVILEQASPDIDPGYPFRSLLFLPKYNKLYKDLTSEEHNAGNHRIAALNKLLPIISARFSR